MTNSEKNTKQLDLFRSVVNVLINLIPVIGVIFFDWSAFDMLFVYVAEAIIVSYFSIKKGRKIFQYYSSVNATHKANVSKPSARMVSLLVFLFFYVFLLLMGVFAHEIHFQKIKSKSLPVVLNWIISGLFPSFVHNPQLLIAVVFTLLGNIFIYLGFIRREEFKSTVMNDPDKFFQRSVLILFFIIVFSFLFFWCATFIGSIFHLNSTRFVNISTATVMVIIKNIIPYINFKNMKKKESNIFDH